MPIRPTPAVGQMLQYNGWAIGRMGRRADQHYLLGSGILTLKKKKMVQSCWIFNNALSAVKFIRLNECCLSKPCLPEAP